MGKMAMVYYSYSNNTKKIAEMVHDKTGAELFRIETITPYTGSFDEVVNQAKKEIDKGFKPPIQSLDMQMDQYDTIFLGTPVWWYTFAPAVLTFLSETDLGGKRIIPFATNGGWLGHTFQDIKKLCPNSEVVSGLNIEFSGNTLNTSVKAIEKWIDAV